MYKYTLYSWLTKARIDFVEDSFPPQTETLVSNKNECITKSRPTKFYSTLCHTAKRTNTITRLNQHKIILPL